MGWNWRILSTFFVFPHFPLPPINSGRCPWIYLIMIRNRFYMNGKKSIYIKLWLLHNTVNKNGFIHDLVVPSSGRDNFGEVNELFGKVMFMNWRYYFESNSDESSYLCCVDCYFPEDSFWKVFCILSEVLRWNIITNPKVIQLSPLVLIPKIRLICSQAFFRCTLKY